MITVYVDFQALIGVERKSHLLQLNAVHVSDPAGPSSAEKLINFEHQSRDYWCSKLISFAAEEGPAVSETCTAFNCNKCDFLSNPFNA